MKKKPLRTLEGLVVGCFVLGTATVLYLAFGVWRGKRSIELSIDRDGGI